MAVVSAIADKASRDAPSITASEFRGVITSPEQAPCLITIVTTVVVVITAVMVMDTASIGTGEGCRRTGVKGWEQGTKLVMKASF